MDISKYPAATDYSPAAKLQSMNAASVLNQPRPPAPLEVIGQRIEGASKRVNETTARLAHLADSLFGCVPESDEVRMGQEADSSALGRIDAALSQLETSLEALEHEALRNCKLA